MNQNQSSEKPRLILGPPADLERALAGEVKRYKAGDPLAPVTILVGNTLLRPYLRLRLAELLGGWISIEFLTFADVGEKLGEMPLIADGRLPLPPLAERVLSRQVALRAGGYFEPVAEAPGFGQALQRLFFELRQAGIDAAALGPAAGEDEKVADLAALFEKHERGRQPFYDATDCLGAADPAALKSRALLVHGVWQPSALQRALLEQLMEVTEVTFFLPATSSDADIAHEQMRKWLAGLGVQSERLNGSRSSGLAGKSVQLLSAPDAPREVVEAARACMTWAREGIAFHEMAVAYRHDDPYQALVESVFDDSGIPIYLHDGTPLVERPLGRRALALLDLIDTARPLQRSAVMEFLTDAELPFETWDRYGRTFPDRWDAISRKAGIVEGRQQWVERLDAYIEDEQQRAERWAKRRAREAEAEEPDQTEDSDEPGELEPPEGPEEATAEPPRSWRADQAERLRSFITDLADRFEARPARAPWSTHVAYLSDLFSTYIKDVEPILDTLVGLAQLDDLPGAGEPSFEQFRSTAREAIADMRAEDPPDKERGQFARQGVNVLDVNSLRDLHFKAVAIVGLVERSFPPPPRQDALLLDHERARLNKTHGWDIPLRAGAPDAEPLQFELALYAATDQLQLSFARTEMGDGRAKLPSHFFRAAASALAGETVKVEDVDGLPRQLFRRVPGSRFAAPSLTEALTPSEYDRTLLRERPELGFAVVSGLLPGLERSRRAHRWRWESRELTVYDGVLGDASHAGLENRGGLQRAMSPSSLETYATCPYRYFLQSVLRLKPEPDPDRIQRIEALERGSLVHEILDRFLTKCEEEGNPPSRDRRDHHLKLLAEIANQEFANCEQHGVTGLPVLWQYDRRTIREDLVRWFDEELADDAVFDSGRFELAFGFEDAGWAEQSEKPLEIDVDGTRLRFRGRIDRLNYKRDGSAFRVIDYKTGRADYKLKDGLLLGGRALQLPIYLRAAATVLGADWRNGSAQYFYVSTKGGFGRISFDGANLAAREDEFERLLGAFAHGIAEGDFHAVPAEKRDNCKWCDFKDLCDARVDHIAERKAGDSKAEAFAKLAEEIK